MGKNNKFVQKSTKISPWQIIAAGLPVLMLSTSALLLAQQQDFIPAVSPDSTTFSQKIQHRQNIENKKSDLDAPIYYEARFFDNDVKKGILYLTDHAVVKYQKMEIKAGKIQVNQETRTLIAEALAETLRVAVDSVLADTEHDSITVKTSQYPVFNDGQQEITGERMVYSFDTQKGIITKGRAEMDGGFNTGSQIKRVNKKVFNVTSGTYTTCDNEGGPHFHFWARRMKLIAGERVIAKPIVLFFGKIPLAYLPFAMFPTKSGRKSGILIPRYGQSTTEGKFLKGLGYYWAINDYLDAKVTADYYDQSGWLFRGGLNYKRRYAFNGRIDGSLTRKDFSSGRVERRWNLNINHSQTIDKTSRFSMSGQFQSDNSYYKDFYFDPNQRLNRQIISQATYSKRLGRNSLNLSFSETRDLDDNSNTPLRRNLPQISFNFATRPLFSRAGEQKRGLGRSRKPGKKETREQRWWETITYGFNTSFSSTYTKSLFETRNDTVYFDDDSLSQNGDPYNVEPIRIFKDDQRSFTKTAGSINISYPGKFFGILKLSQAMRFQEDWFDREFVYEDSTLARSEQKKFARRLTFNYSANASTELYGMFQPQIGSLLALRHVMKPRIGFSYAPDFSQGKWGYYTDVVDADGGTVRHDRFSGTPAQKRGSITFGVDNDFQAKVKDGDKEKKIRLFNANMSGSYNMAASTKKLSAITTRISANPGRNFRFTTALSHSAYAFDAMAKTESDRYLFDRNKGAVFHWLRLTNVNMDASFSLSGKGIQAGAPDDEETLDLNPGFGENPAGSSFSGNKGELSWGASFALRYNVNYFNPANKTKTAYLRVSNAKLQLTRNWRVNFSGQLDLRKKQVVQQTWSIHRDLHCWEASFNWYPAGVSKGFYFRINIKAQTLQDIKLERRSGQSLYNSNQFY